MSLKDEIRYVEGDALLSTLPKFKLGDQIKIKDSSIIYIIEKIETESCKYRYQCSNKTRTTYWLKEESLELVKSSGFVKGETLTAVIPLSKLQDNLKASKKFNIISLTSAYNCKNCNIEGITFFELCDDNNGRYYLLCKNCYIEKFFGGLDA